METSVRELEIQTLKNQLALSHEVCSSLAHEFETETLTPDDKAAIAHRWDHALKERYGLQLALDLLERIDCESEIDAAQAD
jgi:hypothetical protein